MNRPRELSMAAFCLALFAEVRMAREKFPGNKHLLAALTEEVGELSTALLENEGTQRVFEEAVQVACVALRIACEGDGDFAPPPTVVVDNGIQFNPKEHE